jgi:hypothetical protein
LRYKDLAEMVIAESRQELAKKPKKEGNKK